ncbi:acyl carrier protein [Actinomadura barringtoniae]|uniref:Acyl carrier protein n=1 Tax=Actinomadura barringtoniae TaxID=1427535 RepID=A0A939PJG2_9ACTN|nr:acyl carrier protein [Actinomadura barringtoniae]MBO2453283.1 acyl carrier protein [Actinomadura barringtoniae]
MTALPTTSQTDIETWMADFLADRLGLPAAEVDRHALMTDYGMDSVTAISMLEELTAVVGLEIDPDVIWDFPTISALAGYAHERSSQTSEPGVMRPTS